MTISGKANILWPGLNAPILKGREVVTRQQLPPNPEYESQLVKLRDDMSRIRYPSIAPLLRGFSGARFPGQSVGPPDPVADCKGFLLLPKTIKYILRQSHHSFLGFQICQDPI